MRAGPERRVEGIVRRHLDGDPSEHGDAMERQLPGEQLLERADRRRRGGNVRVRAEHDHPGRLRVVAARVGADHRQVDPAGARLPDPAERVDREVVGDVEVVADIAVVVEDRQEDRGDLAGAVAVGRHAVMHERELDRAVQRDVARRRVSLGPRRAGDDRRLARAGVEHRLCQRECLRRVRRRRGGRRRDVVQAHAPYRGGATKLNVVGRSAPDRIAELGRLGRQAIRTMTEHGRNGPRAPAAASRPGPKLDRDARRRDPLDPDQREPPWRGDLGGRARERPDPLAEDAGRAWRERGDRAGRTHQRGRAGDRGAAEHRPARDPACLLLSAHPSASGRWDGRLELRLRTTNLRYAARSGWRSAANTHRRTPARLADIKSLTRALPLGHLTPEQSPPTRGLQRLVNGRASRHPEPAGYVRRADRFNLHVRVVEQRDRRDSPERDVGRDDEVTVLRGHRRVDGRA